MLVCWVARTNDPKIKIKSFECPKSIRNYEKKIILGTSDAWLMSRLAHQPSDLVYDRNHYFGFGPIPKPKLVDTFGRYRNRYRNHISEGKSS